MIALIREKRTYRFRLLFALYKKADANMDAVYDMQELAMQAGMNHNQFLSAWKYLHMEELIQVRPYHEQSAQEGRYHARLMHKGIKAIEEVFLNENQYTYYFPAYREMMS
ncbi:MAG: hypothetical protein JJT94_11560 [Bernardetiaceae bacterium]|nr:hypothetical protein [Bernardetiaceae bacterium]